MLRASSTRSSRRPGHPAGRRPPGLRRRGQARSATKLRMIEQGNLGGSGGFSRAMDEAVRDGRRRLRAAARRRRRLRARGHPARGRVRRPRPAADARRRPHVQPLRPLGAARLRRDRGARTAGSGDPPRNTVHGHDFADASRCGRRQWLHRRVDVDYNGWWMCLIPTEVIREIGLSLPMFIKWDDAEFGLRAGEAGYPDGLPARCRRLARAVAREGRHDRLAGVLPPPQPDRRRAAALAVRPRRPAGPARASRPRSSTCCRCSTAPAEMGLMALEDILDGPQRMHRDVPTGSRSSASCASEYDDSRSPRRPRRVPDAAAAQAAAPGQGAAAPRRAPPAGQDAGAPACCARCCRSGTLSREHPEANVPHVDLKLVAAVPVRLGARLVRRRHRGGLVQARPEPLPLR